MEAKIKVQGMSCGHCVKSIESKVGSISGVESVKVDLKANVAKVRFEGTKTNLETIVAAIEDAGFEAISP